MRKGLLLALAVAAAMASVGTAYAQGGHGNDVPMISLIPDVILGDGDGVGHAPDQTASNYFVFYNGMNLLNYVTDEDDLTGGNRNVKAAFRLTEPTDAGDRNLSISGISQLKTNQYSNWHDQASGGIPDHKNLVGTDWSLTFRAVSDLWDPIGPNIPDDNPGMGLGQYGGVVAGIKDHAFAQMLVQDDDANTAVKEFLVKIGKDGTTSVLEHDALIPPIIITNLWQYPGSYFIDVYRDDVVPPWRPPQHTGTPDYIQLDSSYIGTTANVFGYWEAPVQLVDGLWPDGVVRSRWLFKYDADNTTFTYQVRSRMATAAHLLDLANSEMLVQPVGTPPDINAQRFVGRQDVLSHYFYAGDSAAQLAATGTVLCAIDLVDFQAPFYDTGCPIEVDTLIVDVLDHATLDASGDLANGGDEYSTLRSAVGNELDTWIFRGAQFLGETNRGGTCDIDRDTTWGVGISCDTSAFNIYASMEPDFDIYDNPDPNLKVYPGQLVRSLVTLRDELDTTDSTSQIRPQVRVRIFTTPNFEMAGLIQYANGFANPGDPTPAAGPVWSQDSLAGTTYEAYMEGPLTYPEVAGVYPGDYWSLALDVITLAAPQRKTCDYTVLEGKIHQILLPY